MINLDEMMVGSTGWCGRRQGGQVALDDNQSPGVTPHHQLPPITHDHHNHDLTGDKHFVTSSSREHLVVYHCSPPHGFLLDLRTTARSLDTGAVLHDA